MGTFQRKYLIVEPFAWNKDEEKLRKKLDNWIKKTKYPELFSKHIHPVNSGVTYFMCWDGSKEGWDISEDCNKIRRQFKDKVKELFDSVEFIYIKPKGGIEEKGYILEENYEKSEDEN